MTKILALLLLTFLSLLTTMGNMWYTFGLWPQSWIAFIGFWIISVILAALVEIVRRSDD